MKNRILLIISLILLLYGTISVYANKVYADKNIEDLIILINPSEYVYDGVAKEPTVSLYDGSVIVVSFDARGGTCGIGTKAVNEGSVYGTLPNVERSGFSFVGWYDAVTGGNKIIESTIVTKTENHTLYARWTENG